jgi:hypothetical protein
MAGVGVGVVTYDDDNEGGPGGAESLRYLRTQSSGHRGLGQGGADMGVYSGSRIL